LAINSSHNLHIHTPPLFQVELEKSAGSGQASAQNIGLSKQRFKSELKCTAWSECTPVPDGQTDRDAFANKIRFCPNCQIF